MRLCGDSNALLLFEYPWSPTYGPSARAATPRSGDSSSVCTQLAMTVRDSGSLLQQSYWGRL